MNQGEIAYQNKDITSKLIAEYFKGKTFRVYGLDSQPVSNREKEMPDAPHDFHIPESVKIIVWEH